MDGVLDPGDCMGESLAGKEPFSDDADVGDTVLFFSSPIIASEIALNPVTRVRLNMLFVADVRSIDEVSLPPTFGEMATASMLGESLYSGLVTAGDTDECFRCPVFCARPAARF
jgi:hypothetical protein